MTDEEKIIEGHEYDGIHEFDYPLPGWWLFTFLATIVFAFFYYMHFELGGGQSIQQELKEDLAVIETHKKSAPVKGESDSELEQLMAQAPVIEEGKAVFAGKCAVCHGPQLQGLIGPNLTDDFWIHGQGKPADIIATVRKGVLDKGMPLWEGVLKDAEIKAVTVYVASQIGSNPPNAKAPQGEKVVRK